MVGISSRKSKLRSIVTNSLSTPGTDSSTHRSNAEPHLHAFPRQAAPAPELTTTSPKLDLSKRIPEVDGLRGIAIAAVLIWHYFAMPAVAAPATALSYALVFTRLTWSGVDLFFVLSGFLIGGILLDARASTNYFQVFYTRRFFRIVPIYAALLLVFPVVLFAAPRALHGDFTWLTANALPWHSYWTFTQNFWMVRAVSFGAFSVAVTWSLAVEEQFYLTLPILVRFLSRRALAYFVLAGIVLAPILRIAILHTWPANWLAPFALMPCRADALLLGVLVAMLLRNEDWRARIQRSTLFFAIAAAILLPGIAFLTLRSSSPNSRLMQSLGYTWLALFYALVLLFAVTRPHHLLSRALRLKSLAWLGAIAYGTYLLHEFVLGFLFGLFQSRAPLVTGVSSLLIPALALAVSLVLARLSWFYFENPLVHFGHRFNYSFTRPAALALSKPANPWLRPIRAPYSRPAIATVY
jgi:peptidoglycan/LPS O-acetylase OafA/YrhL